MLVDHLDIDSIVVDKDYQKNGVATSLLNKVLEYAKENKIYDVFLEVRKSNSNAILLYKKFNFEHINTRKRYYPDNGEDALIFYLDLNKELH
ncbi:Protease synthase and sporulation negative regulatory protein PAI 1 [compost metagenome]